VRRYTDMPNLVQLEERKLPDGRTVLVPGRYLRASDFNGKLGPGQQPRVENRGDRRDDKIVLPNGSIGFRWGAEGRGDAGKWNLEDKEARATTHDVKLKLSLMEGDRWCGRDYEVGEVAFPYFGGIDTPTSPPTSRAQRHRRRAGAQGAGAPHQTGQGR
jgi:nitrate reductase alpha subunit